MLEAFDNKEQLQLEIIIYATRKIPVRFPIGNWHLPLNRLVFTVYNL